MIKEQTKLESLFEACVNTGIGFGIAFLTQIILFSFLGYDIPTSTNLLITTVFTVVSIIRGYLVRRLFVYIGSPREWLRKLRRKFSG